MGIHATEDLTALIGQSVEPWRSNHYDFDAFQLVYLAWSPVHLGDLTHLHISKRVDYGLGDWDKARQDCLKELQAGHMVKLLGRVYN